MPDIDRTDDGSGTPRRRMVEAAAGLLARDGLEGTSFSTVLAASGAPRGSIYHHFPGGKEQLVAEAVRATGDRLLAALPTVQAETPADVVRAFTALWRGVLSRSDLAAGCAVAAVTVTGAGDLRPVAAEVFDRWARELAGLLAEAGAAPDRARMLAVTAIAGVEGALVLGRAAQDLAVFDTVADGLVALAGAAP